MGSHLPRAAAPKAAIPYDATVGRYALRQRLTLRVQMLGSPSASVDDGAIASR